MAEAPQVQWKDDAPTGMYHEELELFNDRKRTEEEIREGDSLKSPRAGEVYTLARFDGDGNRTVAVDKRVVLSFLLNPYYEPANQVAEDILTKYLAGEDEEVKAEGVVEKTEEERAAEAEDQARANASEGAVELADEHGIRLTDIEATGSHGHVKGDVERAVAAKEDGGDGA